MSSQSHPRQALVTVFIAYARKDKMLKEKLEEHLSNLRYRGLINLWQDGEVQPGDDWEQEIVRNMERASLVLLLISASFMASHYYRSVEMQQALDRYERGAVTIIPVLLRPAMFTDAPFARLQSLPSNGKSITTWRNRDSAFVDVALGIEKALLQQLETGQTKAGESATGQLRSLEDNTFPAIAAPTLVLFEHLLAFLRMVFLRISGRQHKAEQTYYQQALKAYEEALVQNPADLVALKGKGLALEALQDYAQALAVFRQWTVQDPQAFPYTHIGAIHLKLKQPEEARQAYEQALAHDPQDATACYGLGQALTHLGQTDAATQAYRRAAQSGYEKA